MNIKQNNEEQVVEFESIGKRYIKENATYLLFEEPVMELNQSNKVTCILSEKQVTIIRNGFTKMRQSYILNELSFGFYHTPYGQIEIHTITDHYTYNDNELNLKYQMLINDENVGRNELMLQIKGVE